MIKTISEMLQSQAHSNETIAGPDDQHPAYVQSYCIYQQTAGEDEVRFVAAYTDVLNAAGVVIPRYRTGEFREEDLSLCQLSTCAVPLSRRSSRRHEIRHRLTTTGVYSRAVERRRCSAEVGKLSSFAHVANAASGTSAAIA